MQVATDAPQAPGKVCQATFFSLHSPRLRSGDLSQLWADCQQPLADCHNTDLSDCWQGRNRRGSWNVQWILLSLSLLSVPPPVLHVIYGS